MLLRTPPYEKNVKILIGRDNELSQIKKREREEKLKNSKPIFSVLWCNRQKVGVTQPEGYKDINKDI